MNKRERKWLESREKRLEERGSYSCGWCCNIHDEYTDYKDVALFEAMRVEYLIQAIKMIYFSHPKEAELIIKGCAHYADMKMEK